MSLHRMVLVIATLCISSYMQSVQSQFTSSRHTIWGFGGCPKVSPMKSFDITKIYGQQWYLIAHYSEGDLLDRHCTSFILSDANPGTDICRVSVERRSTEYNDGEHMVVQVSFLLPNETDHTTWIDTLHSFPIKSYTIATDYDKYLLTHKCNEFPRDRPFIYEQQNYISSTQAVWKGGLKHFQKELDFYEGMGIDAGPFILHNQEDCWIRSDVPAPL